VVRRAANSKTRVAPRASLRVTAKLAKSADDIGLLYEWFDAMATERGAQRAVDALSRRAAESSSEAPALVLGYCLFGLGRQADGVKAFELAYRRRPNEQTLYALSGALLVGDRIDEGLALLKAADAKRPLATRPLVNLANAYAAHGDLRASRRALDRISPTGRKEWKQLVVSARERLVWAGASPRGPRRR
jgi:tetratricopeptide (TPR) repeat protein